MKCAAILPLLGLAGCQSYARAVDQGPNHCGLLTQAADQCDIVKAQRDAADNATCLSYGAAPGSMVYVECRLELARERAQRPVVVNSGGGNVPLNCTSLALGGGLTSTNCQ